MTQATVIEGTPDEVLRQAEALIRGRREERMTLVILAQAHDVATGESSPAHALWRQRTSEDIQRALDAIEFRDRPLPVLPPEAFDRENLYEERW